MTDEQEVSDEVLADLLQDTARRVADGELARAERASLIKEADRRGWRGPKIAKLAGMTHQAVYKQLGQKPSDDTTE